MLARCAVLCFRDFLGGFMRGLKPPPPSVWQRAKAPGHFFAIFAAVGDKSPTYQSSPDTRRVSLRSCCPTLRQNSKKQVPVRLGSLARSPLRAGSRLRSSQLRVAKAGAQTRFARDDIALSERGWLAGSPNSGHLSGDKGPWDQAAPAFPLLLLSCHRDRGSVRLRRAAEHGQQRGLAAVHPICGGWAHAGE
jgi:hypothetical protein